MTDDETRGGFCARGAEETCCNVDAIINVDERGQMVLPKELREKAGLGAGEKMAAVSFRQGEDVCCIVLVKVGRLTDMVKGMLGPVMGELLKDKRE